ncbi:MAG: Uma2 family endonuclease [Phycisphaeraceae bacterium]|nr:Uma2 family endonuclease [Phycisphaeraceae bacterium]
MSAVPRIPTDFGLAGLRMTAAEYLAHGETTERYELVDGVVFMSPRPTPRHQKIIQLMLMQLSCYGDEHTGFEFFMDVDLVLANDRVYAPDLVCYLPGKLKQLPQVLNTPPDLLVEVLSPGTKAFDLTTKRNDYEAFGVGEYWAYDPADGRLRRFQRSAGKLVEAAAVGDKADCLVLPGWSLDLRPLRQLMDG